ncbi:hypothetical protein ES703_25878 [subsurface metagenome]
MNHKSQKELLNEWKNIPKHWYNIYNWKSLSRKSYSDYIANIIVDNFDDIQLSMEGIRKENFRFKEHSGQSKLCTSIMKRGTATVFRVGFVKPFLNKSGVGLESRI